MFAQNTKIINVNCYLHLPFYCFQIHTITFDRNNMAQRCSVSTQICVHAEHKNNQHQPFYLHVPFCCFVAKQTSHGRNERTITRKHGAAKPMICFLQTHFVETKYLFVCHNMFFTTCFLINNPHTTLYVSTAVVFLLCAFETCLTNKQPTYYTLCVYGGRFLLRAFETCFCNEQPTHYTQCVYGGCFAH